MMSGEVEGAVVADEDDEEGHWPSRDGHGLFESGERKAVDLFWAISGDLESQVWYHTPS